VCGVTAFVPAGTTIVQAGGNSISTTSATFGSLGANTSFIGSATAGTPFTVPSTVLRVSIAATTTVFLVANGSFTISTLTANGFIRARRVR
jgi:hypothetical protein